MFQILTEEKYKETKFGYLECHLTELVSSNHFIDGSEKYVYYNGDFIILSKNKTENGFVYTKQYYVPNFY